MKGLEGVSDSDFHGWTVPRYGADAKESGGAGVANLAVRGPRNIYMRGRERTNKHDDPAESERAGDQQSRSRSRSR